MAINIRPDHFSNRIFQRNRIAHLLQSKSADRKSSTASPDQLWYDESMNFVDPSEVEKQTQKRAAAFNQQVGDALFGEMSQQLSHAFLVTVTIKRKNCTAAIGEHHNILSRGFVRVDGMTACRNEYAGFARGLCKPA